MRTSFCGSRGTRWCTYDSSLAVLGLTAVLSTAGCSGCPSNSATDGSSTTAKPPTVVAAATTSPPPLTVVLVIDQLRGDLLERFRPLWRGGFARLLDEGRHYSQAFHGHGRTETAAGHATIATGLHPRYHGVVDKKLYDPASRVVQRVSKIATSPAGMDALLFEPTLGDRLKRKHPGAKVVAMGQKARSALLMGGHNPDLVAWADLKGPVQPKLGGHSQGGAPLPRWLRTFYDDVAGPGRISRTWEAPELPPLYASIADDAPGEVDCGHGTVFPHRLPNGQVDQDPKALRKLYEAWLCSPDSDRAWLDTVLQTVYVLDMGKDNVPDLLWLSLAANDIVGHSFGPDSLEQVAQLVELDRLLGDFMAALQTWTGDGLLVGLVSDHGIGATVATTQAQGKPAEQVATEDLAQAAESALRKVYGAPQAGKTHIAAVVFPLFHLSDHFEGEARAKAATVVASALRELPVVYQAWTAEEILREDRTKRPDAHPIASLMRETYHPRRGGDVLVTLRPRYSTAPPKYVGGGAQHGSPWNYDRHSPIVLWGDAASPDKVEVPVQVIDLTRTLGDFLGLEPDPRGGTPLP